MPDHSDAQSEELVKPSHPFGVAARQIIVDGDDVYAFALEGIEVAGKSRNEGFPFAGFHFGDLPLVQRISTDQLHIEVPHVQDSFAGFARDGKRFGKDVVQGRTVRYTLFKVWGFGLELGIGKAGDAGFKGVDFRDDRLDFFDFPFALRPYELGDETFKHRGV